MTKNTAVLIRKPLTESLPMKLFGNSAETPLWLSGRERCRTGRLSMRGFQSRTHSARAQNHHHSYTGVIFFCPAIPTICRWHLRLWNSSTRCTELDSAAGWTMQVHPQQRAWFANTTLIPPSRIRSLQDTRASSSSISNTTWVTAKLISHNKTMWSVHHASSKRGLQAFWRGVKFSKLL